jgi:hypothetical protein
MPPFFCDDTMAENPIESMLIAPQGLVGMMQTPGMKSITA